MNEHRFSLTELDDMFPYEREIYVMILLQHIDKKKKSSSTGAIF